MSKKKSSYPYTKEFKQEAVKLALTTGKPAQTARDLGVSDSALYRWLAEAKESTAVPIEGNDVLTLNEVAEELKRVKKELAITKEERDILKKATAYFAKISL
jgi:transposase